MNNVKKNSESFPKVSVIMCLYATDNLDAFRDATESILNQDYPFIDLFICQDGPISDDVFEYINKLINDKDNIFLLVNKKNKGFAFSLNKLINRSIESNKYEYIARMDGDDVAHRSRITKQVEFMENDPSISVSGTFVREFGSSFSLAEKKLPLSHNELVKYSIGRCPFIHSTVIFRSNVFLTGIRYPLVHLDEDMSLWYQLILEGHTLSNLGEILQDFKLDEGSIVRRKMRGPFSDFTNRLRFLKQSNQIGITNIFQVALRLVFSLMPVALMKIFYKYFR